MNKELLPGLLGILFMTGLITIMLWDLHVTENPMFLFAVIIIPILMLVAFFSIIGNPKTFYKEYKEANKD